jgi:lysozyme
MTLRLSERGLVLIKEFEGFSAAPYQCSAGRWTIGYGHLIKGDERFLQPIDENTAEALLREDIAQSEQAVGRLVKVALSQGQFDALVSFVFNLGQGAFSQSTLLRLLNAENYREAAKQFLRWDFAGGRRIAGLSRRRAAEKELFLS